MTITRQHVLSLLAASLATVACSVPAAASAPSAAGTLDLKGTLRLESTPVECTSADATGCRARTAKGVLSGLGIVSVTYTWSFRIGPPTCPSDVGKPLATTGRLVVAGKGEIDFALADGTRCVELDAVRDESQDFTITSGAGIYERASGRGTVETNVGGGRGTEQLPGTLVVPGIEFDVTPPTLVGATAKTIHAPKGAGRVRVTYLVSARDDVDPGVPVSCSPRSGTRFPIGRTVVTCSATDTSGNTKAAKFVITVRTRR